jgi:arylsulfatase A-like enzyme
MGDWKAVRLAAAKAPDALLQLFNLATDPGETTDVATSNPDILTKATTLLKSSRFPSPEFPMGLLDHP